MACVGAGAARARGLCGRRDAALRPTRCERPGAWVSRSARAPDLFRCSAVSDSAASGSQKLSVKQMRVALEAAGVRTGDLLERSDYEARFASLPSDARAEAMQQATDAAGGAGGREATGGSSSEKPADARSVLSEAWAKLASAVEEQKRLVVSGELLAGLRSRLAEYDALYSVTARCTTLADKVGLTSWWATNGPSITRAITSPQVASVVSSLVFSYLLISGLLFKGLGLLTLGLVFVNVFYPSLMRNYVRDLTAKATARMAAMQDLQQQRQGGMPPPGAARRAGDQTARRKTYGDGPVIDADFKSVDKK